jgi:hypothetical protein
MSSSSELDELECGEGLEDEEELEVEEELGEGEILPSAILSTEYTMVRHSVVFFSCWNDI